VVDDCNRALRLLPEYTEVIITRGNAHQALGNIDDAIADYRRALELSPNDVTALTDFSSAYNELGKHRESIELAEQALAVDPNNPHARSQLAVAHRRLGNLEAALQNYSKILESHPSWTNSIRPLRADLLFKLGRNDLALHESTIQIAEGQADYDTYNRLTKLEPDEPSHYFNRSRHYGDPNKQFDDLVIAMDLCRKRRTSKDSIREFCRIAKAAIAAWMECRWQKKDSFRWVHVFMLYDEQIKFARSADDRMLLYETLDDAIDQALKVNLTPKALDWSLDQLETAGKLSGDDIRSKTERAYINLIKSVWAKGDPDRAITICCEALPKYDCTQQLFDLMNVLYKRNEYERVAGVLETIGERFTNDQDGCAYDVAYVCCLYLSEVYVRWRKPQIFDMERALVFARKGCHLKKPPIVEIATRLWAIAEAMEPGSGDKEVGMHVSDPVVRERARNCGPDELKSLGLTAKVAQ
jgi:tetratricopeptide (TPR) repeat protein